MDLTKLLLTAATGTGVGGSGVQQATYLYGRHRSTIGDSAIYQYDFGSGIYSVGINTTTAYSQLQLDVNGDLQVNSST